MTPDRAGWLERLPDMIRALQRRWSLTLDAPFDGGSCAWVAPAVTGDGVRAVLKIGMPHMEGEHELHGLRFWDGDPTVRLLDADEHLNAMLLERCDPGTPLRTVPEAEQDVVIGGLLRRAWRKPAPPHPFRPLAAMVEYWSDETIAAAPRWSDPGLVREGLRLFAELARPSADDVLLVTDLHAGNVLSSRREAWLAIDPKPFVGDRAYDATQHLFNCKGRMLRDPAGTIARVADLLEIDAERVRLWMFARSSAEPRADWGRNAMTLAKSLA